MTNFNPTATSSDQQLPLTSADVTSTAAASPAVDAVSSAASAALPTPDPHPTARPANSSWTWSGVAQDALTFIATAAVIVSALKSDKKERREEERPSAAAGGPQTSVASRAAQLQGLNFNTANGGVVHLDGLGSKVQEKRRQ